MLANYYYLCCRHGMDMQLASYLLMNSHIYLNLTYINRIKLNITIFNGMSLYELQQLWSILGEGFISAKFPITKDNGHISVLSNTSSFYLLDQSTTGILCQSKLSTQLPLSCSSHYLIVTDCLL